MVEQTRTEACVSARLRPGEYLVEKILSKKSIGGEEYYLIKWAGYPLSECTWEPKSNLTMAGDLVREFESSGQGTISTAILPKKNKAPQQAKPCLVDEYHNGNPSLKKNEYESYASLHKRRHEELRLGDIKQLLWTVGLSKKAVSKSKATHKNCRPRNLAEARSPFPQPNQITGHRKPQPGHGLEYAIEWQMKGKKEPLKARCCTDDLAKHWPRMLIDYLEQYLIIKQNE